MKLLQANNIPPDTAREIIQSDISGQDFVAWILYAYSQEGRGIKKPGFFAVKRLLNDPPVMAQWRWQQLAASGPGFVGENIRCAMDPIGGDVDREWWDAMGKVQRERLEQLERDLCLEAALEDP